MHAELSCTMTKLSFYDELDALLQFNCEMCRNAEIGCTISRMRALPPKLGEKRCIGHFNVELTHVYVIGRYFITYFAVVCVFIWSAFH